MITEFSDQRIQGTCPAFLERTSDENGIVLVLVPVVVLIALVG